jgi:hypothetical protein
MIFSRKNKKLVHRLEKEIPEFIANPIKKPSNTTLIGLGVVSFVSSALLDRILKRSIWGPVLGVWGPLFIVLGLYSKVTRLENELAEAKSH